MVFGASKTKLFEQPLDKLVRPAKQTKQLSSNNNSNGKHTTATRTRSHPALTYSTLTRSRHSLSALPEPIRQLLRELYLRGPSTVGIFRKSPNAKHCKELRHKLEAASAAGQSSIQQFQVNVIASVLKEWLRSLPDCLLMSRLYPQWIDVAKLIEPLHLHQQRLLQSTSASPSSYSSSSAATSPSREGSTDGSALARAASASFGDGTIRSDGQRGEGGGGGGGGLRPSAAPSPMTDSGHEECLEAQQAAVATTAAAAAAASPAPPRVTATATLSSHSLVRALSCSEMTSDSGHSSSQSSSPVASQDETTNIREDKQELLHSAADPALYSHTAATNLKTTTTPPPATAAAAKDLLTMSEFALRERNSECIRIVRQLLDNLNEANLILLRAIICVLWHISDNSEHNKMSSTNLGVCVGQSLLNDENQPKSGHLQHSSHSASRFSASTFTKRHKRTRSQGLLSSTLSLSNLSPISNPSGGSGGGSCNNNNYLTSNTAQETAKYVPMLIAFMIDNAQALFGPDIDDLFGPTETNQQEQVEAKRSSVANDDDGNVRKVEEMAADSKRLADNLYGNINFSSARVDGADRVDGINLNLDQQSSNCDGIGSGATTFRRQQNILRRVNRNQTTTIVGPGRQPQHEIPAPPTSPGQSFRPGHRRNLSTSVLVHVGNAAADQRQKQQQQHEQKQPIRETNLNEMALLHLKGSSYVDAASATTTSILIVNTPKKLKQRHELDASDCEQNELSSVIVTSAAATATNEGCAVGEVAADSRCGPPAQQRPLSATESTTSSSRASSSTSGVHSESPAFSTSEPDSQHNCASSQRTATTCSSSSSASISSPSSCTSPVGELDADVVGCRDHLTHLSQLHQSQCNVAAAASSKHEDARRRCLSEGHLKDGAEGEDGARGDQSATDAATELIVPAVNRTERPKSMISLNETQQISSQQYLQQQQQRDQPSNFARYQSAAAINASHYQHTRGGTQTLNRHASTSSQHVASSNMMSTNNRLPKIPFQYTTSCYGGEAVLYYPSYAQSGASRHSLGGANSSECQRSHSLNKHFLLRRQQQQQQQPPPPPQLHQPQRSHVMMLRDYYLSLQQQRSQEQQRLESHRRLLRPRSQQLPSQQQHLCSQQPSHQHHLEQLAHQANQSAEQHSLPLGVQQLQQHRHHHLHHQQAVAVERHPFSSLAADLNQISVRPTEDNNSVGATGKCNLDNKVVLVQPQPAASVVYQRPQPRLARIRSSQFNGLYVKRASTLTVSPSEVSAAAAATTSSAESGSCGAAQAGRLVVRPLGKSATLSSNSCNAPASSCSALSRQRQRNGSKDSSWTEHSADDSDECAEWMESTMV